MGRKKLWAKRITLPLSTELLGRVDKALAKDEARVDLIRAAVERELKRRERQKGK